MKFVSFSLSTHKPEGSLAEAPKKTGISADHAPKPPMNAPRIRNGRQSLPESKPSEPARLKSPFSSSVRGDPKKDKAVSNEEIMALLLKVLNK